MKRYGIFVFFNEHGRVEPYVEIVLNSFQSILSELAIIINGEISVSEKQKLTQFSSHIFQRDNVGYDGGAYKDAFTLFLKGEDWTQWDELLLINDTFYGPFYDWYGIFKDMDSRKCDFWGLSSHPGGKENLFGEEIISSHIQSYFILVKQRMFLHPSFQLFWENIEYPKSYKEAIKNFEIYFTEYFFEKGFSYESWVAVKSEQMGVREVPHMGKMELLIKKWKFPILKRKAWVLQDYISLKSLFKYLSEDTDYPVEILREDLRQRCLEGKMEPYNPREVLWFCDQYEKIYLFGMGGYAKNIEQFLKDYGKRIRGYIVSKAEETQEQVYELEEFVVKPDRGVIVALNYRNFNEVYEKLSHRIPTEQILVPYYDYE